jgi:hypothetical protein
MDVAKISAIVGSHMFWQYNKLMLLFISCLEHIGNWMEGCPCHPSTLLHDGEAVPFFKKRRMYEQESGTSGRSCPSISADFES